jgi:hypothetical protein
MAAPRTVYWYEESARLTRGAAFIGQVCHAMLGLYRGGAVKLTMPLQRFVFPGHFILSNLSIIALGPYWSIGAPVWQFNDDRFV